VADEFYGGEDDPAVRLGHAGDRSRAARFLYYVVSNMARDATDLWIEQQPDVSDRRALRRWLDEMPEVKSQTPSPADDGLIYKTVERPPPVEKETTQMDPTTERAWNDWAEGVARGEALRLVEGLADEVGGEFGKLVQRNSELERRVRELELQLSYEKRIRELELKIIKLNADMDADHSRTAAPLIPLRGGRGSAA
jgi:hypothetical protein